ncbi:type 4a pilus biogenesis protein PilO [Chromatium okenii]|uniref:Pilus assembly protein PilO n=1 Tax=Chromatium okenii TaxID=61644 RepID=A0A2S7XNZ1_9GAMM|nr:type 4a pilus biogenesis protein PilO [Chromatium okenii]MBV5308588.1 type 4a pilus biogenesis protein PilO [Chromatium okenii]PQJ95293.1 pilus assembly protein PilO [Chromatium okenii]
MDLNELNELDLSGFGEWPIPVKAVVILIFCIALGGLVFYLDTQDQLIRFDQEKATEAELKISFEGKQRKASNLDAYRQQLAEMQESFGAMLRQLPNKTEVASLLVDVSQTGLANGLEFELFQPNQELTKDFYAELPIDIRVTGNYHDFGRFISGLAALPRIVTVHDVQIASANKPTATDKNADKSDDKNAKLTLQATVKTYRYLDEETKK